MEAKVLETAESPPKVKRVIVWRNVIAFIILHVLGVYGFFYLLVHATILTWIHGYVVSVICGLGVTIGAHRYYTHRAFKANFLIRCVFIGLFTLAGQNCLYIWVRDHRQHHKYTETDADPHNSTRGFFFSHCGWLMVRKHPDVIKKGKTIDLSDLEADSLVMFQKKYYIPLHIVVSLIMISVPCLLWGETVYISILGNYFVRQIIMLNVTWSVNSAAHLYGTRPYNRSIQPVESKFVSFVSAGEGWHNYHHTFPSDYRASEYGKEHDLSTWLINCLAKKGWVYDLKETPQHIVNNWVQKFGDGEHPLGLEEENVCYNTKHEVRNGNLINCKDSNSIENKIK